MNEIEIRITSDDKSGPGFASARRRSDELGSAFHRTGAAGDGLGGTLRRVGQVAAVGLAGGLGVATAAIVSTIRTGIDYQNQLNTMQAVTHATSAEMALVAQRARDLGNDLSLPATSAGDAAEAMTELAKGNLTAKQAMDAAKGTLQLAAAAQITGAEAAKIQADALGAFSLKAGAAGHVADVLANAANSATGEISDFAQGLAASSAVAHQFGLSVDDTVTALALFANAGIHGSDAGTSLKSALLALASPSDQAAKALRVLHVQAFDARGRFVGLEAISQQLAAAQGRLSQQTFAAATSTAFGSDAARAAGVLAAAGGVGWDKMAGAIGRAGGASDAAGAKMKGVGGALAGLKSQIETISIDAFTAMAPVLERVIRALSDRLPKAIDAVKAGFNDASRPVKAVADGLNSLEAGLKPIGALLGAASAGFKPLGRLLDETAKAGAFIPKAMGPLKPSLDAARAAADGVKDAFTTMGPVVGETAKLMGDAAKPLGPLIKTGGDEARRSGLEAFFYAIGRGIANTVLFARRLADGFAEWKAKVGAVLGPIVHAVASLAGHLVSSTGDALHLAEAIGIVVVAAKTLAAAVALAAAVNPATALIAGLALLAAGFTVAYTKAEGFREGVNRALAGVAGGIGRNRYAIAAFGAEAVAVLLRVGGNALIMAGFFVKGVGYIIGWWHTLLHVVLDVYAAILHGAAAAFGWLPGIGGKIKDARDAFDAFSRKVDTAMSGAAKAAGVAGDGLITLGRATVDASDKAVQLRKRMAELHSRQLIIQAIDRAKPVADRIRAAIGQVRGRRVDIVVNQVGSIQRIQREINELTGRVIAIQVGTVRGPGARGEATGGIIGAATGGAHGGLRWVGEYGAELVRLPYGSTVYPHGQSMAMAAAGSARPGGVVIQVQPGGTGLDRMFVDWLRLAVRSRGGVDVVFAR